MITAQSMGFSPHILIFFAIVAGVSRQYRSFSVLFRWRGCHPVLQDFPDTDRASGEKQISESPDNEKTSLYSIFTGIIQKIIPNHGLFMTSSQSGVVQRDKWSTRVSLCLCVRFCLSTIQRGHLQIFMRSLTILCRNSDLLCFGAAHRFIYKTAEIFYEPSGEKNMRNMK